MGVHGCSKTLIAFVRFCSNLHHILTIRQCIFDRKIGAEGSVLQELCHFVIITIRCLHMTGSTYFVKSTPPRDFIRFFQCFADMLQTY